MSLDHTESEEAEEGEKFFFHVLATFLNRKKCPMGFTLRMHSTPSTVYPYSVYIVAPSLLRAARWYRAALFCALISEALSA